MTCCIVVSLGLWQPLLISSGIGAGKVWVLATYPGPG